MVGDRHELRRIGRGRDRFSASLLDRPAAHRRSPCRVVAVRSRHRRRDELRGEHEPRAAHGRCRSRRRAGDARIPRRQSRSDRSRAGFQAAVGDRSGGRGAGGGERWRFPVPRCGDRHLRGRDAAVDLRAAHAHGLRPDRDAHARRQPRLLDHRLHHRGRFSPDPAGPGLHAARHRRHGGDQPHLRRERAARRHQERHAGQASVPARSGPQRAGHHQRAREGLSGAQRQLSGWPARQDRLVHAHARADADRAHPRVRRAQAPARARTRELAPAVEGQRSGAHQPRRRRRDRLRPGQRRDRRHARRFAAGARVSR